IFFLSHTFARHRPKNGATATIANAIPKATRICSPLLDSLSALPSREVPRQLTTDSTSSNSISLNIYPVHQARYPTFGSFPERTCHTSIPHPGHADPNTPTATCRHRLKYPHVLHLSGRPS